VNVSFTMRIRLIASQRIELAPMPASFAVLKVGQ